MITKDGKIDMRYGAKSWLALAAGVAFLAWLLYRFVVNAVNSLPWPMTAGVVAVACMVLLQHRKVANRRKIEAKQSRREMEDEAWFEQQRARTTRNPDHAGAGFRRRRFSR